MKLFSFFVLIVIFSTSIGKYLLVDLNPKQEVTKDSVDERCKEEKCGESCHPKPGVYGACDDNQQCVALNYHPGCKDRERPGPLCEGPPHYGGCKPLSYGFTFDIVSKTCKKVAISGCGRTKNAFHKLEECEKKCSGPLKSSGEVDGEVDNIASVEKSDRAVKPFDHSNPPSFTTPMIDGGVCFCDLKVQLCCECRGDCSSDDKVSR